MKSLQITYYLDFSVIISSYTNTKIISKDLNIRH